MATERNKYIVSKDAVGVEGLRELGRSLDGTSRKVQRIQFKRAAEHVVGVARGKMESNISGAAASALRAIGSNTGAAIAFPKGGRGSGREDAGYYPWLDFGGGAAKGRGVTASSNRQSGSGARRTVIREGRYLYPAISESKAYLQDVAGDAVIDAARSEHLETRG
jgi:hypothetical protein